MLDLVSHRLADLVDPVGNTFLDRELQRVRRERGEHRRVQVPAGGRDRVAGRDNAGPVDPPGVDGLAKGDVEQVATGFDEQAEVAHGRETGSQRTSGIADRPQHPRRGVVLHLRQPGRLAAPAHQEVDLHVHQTGQQDLVAEIDDVAFGFAPDPDDPVAVDAYDSRRDDLAGVDIEQPGGLERQHRFRSPAPG